MVGVTFTLERRKDNKNMASISDLFTLDACNTPEKMHIGGEYIEILGTDSDAFQKARRQVDLDVMSGTLDAERATERLIAALIVGWSYKEECNDANKLLLVKNTPSLANRIDIEASKRANFIARQQAALKNTQKPSSGTKEKTKAAKSPEGKQDKK